MSPGWQLALATVPAAVSALFVYLQASKQSRERAAAQRAIANQSASLERRKLAEEADERARVMYGKLLDDMRSEIERLHKSVERVQTQYDRVANQLSHEQDQSIDLRRQVDQLQFNIAQLRSHIAVLERIIRQLGGEIPTEIGTLPPVPGMNIWKEKAS